eukprot:scaffold54502_cov26-Tisochrysis_lutea.AAC.1
MPAAPATAALRSSANLCATLCLLAGSGASPPRLTNALDSRSAERREERLVLAPTESGTPGARTDAPRETIPPPEVFSWKLFTLGGSTNEPGVRPLPAESRGRGVLPSVASRGTGSGTSGVRGASATTSGSSSSSCSRRPRSSSWSVGSESTLAFCSALSGLPFHDASCRVFACRTRFCALRTRRCISVGVEPLSIELNESLETLE